MESVVYGGIPGVSDGSKRVAGMILQTKGVSALILTAATFICDSMAGMTHWLIIRVLKDAVLMGAIVAAIVIIYRKIKPKDGA